MITWVSNSVIRELIESGAAYDREQAIALADRMAREGAIVTREEGNRRFGDFILNVVPQEIGGDRIESITVDNYAFCRDCYGTELIRVPDGNIRCPTCRSDQDRRFGQPHYGHRGI